MFSLCRIDECLFETTSPDLGVAQSQPSTYNAQTNVSNQLIMDMQKLAGPQRKEFEREIDKLRQEQVDKNSRSDISNSGGKSWTAVEVPATDKAMPHSLVADDEHIMAGPFHLPGLPGGRPLDDDDDLDDDGCGRKTKKKTRIRKKQAEGNQDAGAVVIFPHHPLRVHHLSRRPQVLRNRLCGQENIGAV